MARPRAAWARADLVRVRVRARVRGRARARARARVRVRVRWARADGVKRDESETSAASCSTGSCDMP